MKSNWQYKQKSKLETYKIQLPVPRAVTLIVGSKEPTQNDVILLHRRSSLPVFVVPLIHVLCQSLQLLPFLSVLNLLVTQQRQLWTRTGTAIGIKKLESSF